MEIRNVKKTAYENVFECEYNHPQFGWIPFAAMASDCEKLGRDIHAEIISGRHIIAECDPKQ
ncbi:MAG: hypothetical protein C0603_05590 [Denitrovibrio sp.]|nr:MAG: hypothetical protein C0603_05590 [Denitrovibrio sp.]